ncbi:hypothetical protein GDO78_016822 [Eleutherodactylus coqui]|uniref:Olfactory receptor n=1 Tax=Eleutherodactylus coqui TaxID=57060 RepID=A0A8J6C881_ELECQ|nr:hypothetical protein GDO78_016822 [Eleutherodactylus coqui]
MEETNGTIVDEFILQGFPGSVLLHTVMFIALLVIYIVTLAGNILIIIIVSMDYRLHLPMYFFIVCLSCLEVIAISTVVPKFVIILFSATPSISKVGCFVQSYLFYFTSTADLLLLTVMSIDRCVAICCPLRYSSIMINSICFGLMFGCLIPPFFTLLYPTIIISNLPFCGNVLNHFFCETTAMLKLICIDISLIKLNSLFSSILILIGCLLITTVSYLLIVITVIRLPTDTGRQKTFSTCVSHLTMLSLFFGSAIFILIRPPKEYSVETDKVVNLVSTVLAPLLNPFVYSLRNQKVKKCIQDAFKQIRIL